MTRPKRQTPLSAVVSNRRLETCMAIVLCVAMAEIKLIVRHTRWHTNILTAENYNICPGANVFHRINIIFRTLNSFFFSKKPNRVLVFIMLLLRMMDIPVRSIAAQGLYIKKYNYKICTQPTDIWNMLLISGRRQNDDIKMLFTLTVIRSTYKIKTNSDFIPHCHSLITNQILLV